VICGSPDSQLAANDYANTTRRRLGELLTLPPSVDVALAPSGTDVELLALALAAGGSKRPVVNILVGPGEVGSGTPQAAACRHYDELTPSGVRVTPGTPVDSALASLVDVRNVDLRLATGEMHSESEIDASVVELFVAANDADAIVLLHIVAHSKTGVHAPSLACAERLRKTSEDVVVVVDAAQGRFSRRGLRDVLKNDYLVMFTGSKFYGGPPFSGALLVPQKYRPENRGLSQFPDGFGAYFTAAEMPETWPEVRRQLPKEANIGSILRWAAALAEIEAYYDAPNDARLRVLRYFEAEAPRILGDSKIIRLLPVFPPVYDDTAERLLESKTTVFGFWVTPPGDHRPLGKTDLKQMHAELTTDCSTRYPALDRAIMRRQYHLGQPVDLGSAGSVLRVALGGELITRVATDTRLGKSLPDRLAWLGNELVGLRQKIECLAAVRAPGQSAFPAVAVMDQNVLAAGMTPNAL
jgi:selenocysteine lyase/cysteine desulfurase